MSSQPDPTASLLEIHLFCDFSASKQIHVRRSEDFFLARWAMRLGKRAPTEHHTYGLRRAYIPAALFNGCLLLLAIGAIAWEAVGRFRHPQPVAGATIIWVAAEWFARQNDCLPSRSRRRQGMRYVCQ